MRALRRLVGFAGVLAGARRHRTDLARWLMRRPLLGATTLAYESALLLNNRVDPRLKQLAELKAAAMLSCEYCLDIGSALARRSGVTEDQLRDLPRYRDSPAFDELERLVIAFAEAMTTTPAVDPADVRERLLEHLSRTQLAELAATVAWENQRGRLNQALGVRSTGISDGAACALPETRPAA